MFYHPGARCAAHLESARRIAKEFDDCFNDGLRIAGRNEKAGHLGDNRIASAGGFSGDDRNAGGRGLQNRIGKSLAPGGKNHQVHAAVVRRGVGDESGAMDARMGEYATAQLGIERVFGAVEPADEEQMC